MTAGNGSREELILKLAIAGIRQEYNYLTELLLFGELDADSYLKELNKTVAFDESGEPWAISPVNGNWYRLTEEGPVLGEPPQFLYRPAQDLEEGAGEGEEVAPAAPSGIAAKQAGRGKFCTNCGSGLREGAKFCRECGTPAKRQGEDA